MKKPIMAGLDFLRGAGWTPILAANARTAKTIGERRMPADLKRAGFEVFVWEGPEHFRVAYGKKV